MPGVVLIVSISDICLLPYLNTHTIPTHKKYCILCYPLRSNSGWLPIRCAYFILFPYSAWMQYYLLKKRKKEELERKMAKAAKHHAHRMMRKHLEEWTVSDVFVCK